MARGWSVGMFVSGVVNCSNSPSSCSCDMPRFGESAIRTFRINSRKCSCKRAAKYCSRLGAGRSDLSAALIVPAKSGPTLCWDPLQPTRQSPASIQRMKGMLTANRLRKLEIPLRVCYDFCTGSESLFDLMDFKSQLRILAVEAG